MTEHEPALEKLSKKKFTRRKAIGMGAVATASVAIDMNGRFQDWRQPHYDLSRGEAIKPNFDIEVRPIAHSFDLLHGQNLVGETEPPIDIWAETPGIEVLKDGRLLVQPLDMKIINKRDLILKPYVDNPPINVCGGYLRTNGDFSIETTLSSEGPVHVQLYGKVPKVMDDNRYESARLDCEISSNKLRVRRWSGLLHAQVTHDFELKSVGNEHALRVEKVGDKLTFMVDGYEAGTMSEGGVFDDGNIWLGLNTVDAYATVSQMTFREMNNGPQESGFCRTDIMKVKPSEGETFQGLMDAKGIDIMMGSAVSLYPLMTDPRYAQLMLGGNYKILTIENAMKELYLMSMNGTWEPKHALSLIRVLQDHGILINGHTAIYDKAMHKSIEQMPTETYADKMRIAKYIEDHIVKFGEEFGQYLYSCDVVNEAIDGFGPKQLQAIVPFLRRFGINLPAGVHLRENVFTKALGKEWLAIAFKTAAQVMPNTKLGMNEYGLEIDPKYRGKMAFGLADHIESRGGRVDYIGDQMHIYVWASFVVRSVYRELLNEARIRGRTLRTAEMDVAMLKGEVVQGQQYGMVLEENMRYSDVVEAHITWGSDDGNGSTGGRRPGNELPYDEDFQEKFAARQIKDTIRNFNPAR